MPTSKDHESKKKKARRRPGREEIIKEMEIAEELNEEVPEQEAAAETFEAEPAAAEFTATPPARKKIHIEFPYSEAVRAKVPKAFDLAENVAEEWVNDGNFENVPLKHPLAQLTVAAGLRKVKEVEKKLEEKGVFTLAKMGLEYAKSKLPKK